MRLTVGVRRNQSFLNSSSKRSKRLSRSSMLRGKDMLDLDEDEDNDY
jgi:hypothetical protein